MGEGGCKKMLMPVMVGLIANQFLHSIFVENRGRM